MRNLFLGLTLTLLSGAALAQAPAAPPPPLPPQGAVLFSSAEYRFQLDLAVNPVLLARLLPAGWESAVAAAGAAKDCNLRLIFIDRDKADSVMRPSETFNALIDSLLQRA